MTLFCVRLNTASILRFQSLLATQSNTQTRMLEYVIYLCVSSTKVSTLRILILIVLQAKYSRLLRDTAPITCLDLGYELLKLLLPCKRLRVEKTPH